MNLFVASRCIIPQSFFPAVCLSPMYQSTVQKKRCLKWCSDPLNNWITTVIISGEATMIILLVAHQDKVLKNPSAKTLAPDSVFTPCQKYSHIWQYPRGRGSRFQVSCWFKFPHPMYQLPCSHLGVNNENAAHSFPSGLTKSLSRGVLGIKLREER